MVKLVTGLLVLLAAVAANGKADMDTNGTANVDTVEDEDEPCCQGRCTETGTEKYYSICSDYGNRGHCGDSKAKCSESCLKPADVPSWRGYDKNLTKADTDSPCKKFGYPAYGYTTTFHPRTAGFWTSDYYLKHVDPSFFCDGGGSRECKECPGTHGKICVENSYKSQAKCLDCTKEENHRDCMSAGCLDAQTGLAPLESA